MYRKPRGTPPPLLGKGGAHQRCRSSHRFSARRTLDDALDEWYEEQREADSTDMEQHTEQGGQKPPCSFLSPEHLAAELISANYNVRSFPTILPGI